ncbi:MAG: conditioned medium-induced protein 4 [Halobacteriota archaeon]
MDEKTAELRDIFIDATGSDTVTERQVETRGSLTDDERDVGERLAELVSNMRERYSFSTDLPDDALVTLIRGFYDDQTDAALANELGVDESTVFDARMDLHLVGEDDRDAPFDLAALRALLRDGASLDACADELDASTEVVAHYRAVVDADSEATRANDRFRDEFAELLTDTDLTAQLARDAREDGLKDATEDIETDVSF